MKRAAVLFVADVTLRFENPQQRAGCRVRRWIGQSFHHFGGCGPALLVEDVHDLPLATAESGVGSCHGV